MLEKIDTPDAGEESQATPNDKYKYNLVELPSKGALGYPSEIEYRDILVKDEKELASTTEKTFAKVLNNILSGLLKDNTYFDDLSIHDRDFLILWIWANNYSTTKDIEYGCPQCGAHNKEVVDLTKLDVKPLSDKFQNPYPYTLSNGEEASFRLLTVKDENLARTFCNTNKNFEESFVMMCMSLNLKTVMPLKDKIKYIEENLTGRDMSKLRGFHKHYKYGIDEIVDAVCESCGEVNKIAIPFQVEFFIPSLSDDFE